MGMSNDICQHSATMNVSDKTTCIASAGVDVLIDEEVVGEMVKIFGEIHLEEGEEAEYDMDALATMIHEEIADEIAADENAAKAAVVVEEPEVICGDLELLISSIATRKDYQDKIDKVNEAEYDDFNRPMVIDVSSIFDLEQDLLSSQDEGNVVIDVNSISDLQEHLDKLHMQSVPEFQTPAPPVEQAINESAACKLQPNPDCRSKTKPNSKKSLPVPPANDPTPVALLNDQQLESYVQGQKSVNTVRRTNQVLDKFKEFVLHHYMDRRECHTLDACTLNNYLSNYILTAKRMDGGSFEPDTLTSIHRAVDRHLRDKKYPYSILTDPEFEASRAVLTSRRKELTGQGKGGRPNKSASITPEDHEQLWVSGVLGAKTPKSLQDTIFYFLTAGFGFRGCHESRQLKWGDVVMGRDPDSTMYLELKCERITKTRQGAEGGHQRAYNPKVYEDQDHTQCPVTLYQLLGMKRPKEMCETSSPFYLTVKKDAKASDKVWYKVSPMGINTLSRIIPSMAEMAGLEGKYTNHSLRRTTCQNLLEANIPSTASIQLTGHASVDSLNHYAVASKRQQKDMALIATGQKRLREDEAATTLYTPPPTPSVPSENAATAGPNPPFMAGLAAAASGMFAGATIGGGVSVNFNFQPQSGNVMSTTVDMDIQTSQAQ